MLRQSLVDKVYQHLTAQIARQQFDVDDRLNSRQIASDLRVSRTTVNKAVERLVADGWVRPDDSRHAVVIARPQKLKIHEDAEFEFANQTDTTYEVLLERLLRGDFGPGEIINERPLAIELAVNPATLRRAAEWLSRDGMLERLPRRGWRMTLLTPADIRETYDIRILLEPRVMTGAVKRITDADLNELEEDAQRMIGLGENATVYDRREADYHFHQKICLSADRRFLSETLEPLIRKVLLITTVSFHYGQASRSFEEHLQVLAALRERDEKRAVTSIKAHLRNAKKHYVEMSDGR